MQTTGKFTRGTNQGLAKCDSCGRQTQRGNVDLSTGLCFSNPTHPNGLGCYDIAGIENEHQDGYHEVAPEDSQYPESYRGPQEDCPMCNPARPETFSATTPAPALVETPAPKGEGIVAFLRTVVYEATVPAPKDVPLKVHAARVSSAISHTTDLKGRFKVTMDSKAGVVRVHIKAAK